MDRASIRIVYMGTPEFAVAPLQTLLESGCRVLAVVTAPDRPAGRGKNLRQSAVKTFASSHGIPVLQPEKLKDAAFISQLDELRPDLQVVVAFRMLPSLVWKIPSLGTFNLHASLLPQYRGAAPINHVIINGEKVSGITSFMIDEKIDTGNILLQKELPIGKEETAGELHDRLMTAGASLVLETVDQLAAGKITARPQLVPPGALLHPAPKISREDCKISWSEKGEKIVNLIRGLSPYPGAFTLLEEDRKKSVFKIYRARFIRESHEHIAGTIFSDGKSVLQVAVPDGMLHVLSLQQEGKKRMDIEDFLRGYQVLSGRSRFS